MEYVPLRHLSRGTAFPRRLDPCMLIRVFAVLLNMLWIFGYPHSFLLYLRDDGLYVTPASILYKSIAGRYRPVRVADGPRTARYRFIKNGYWNIWYAFVCHCLFLVSSLFMVTREGCASWWHFLGILKPIFLKLVHTKRLHISQKKLKTRNYI